MTDLRQVLAAARAVLLDFDGPVSQLLPSGSNAALADSVREPLWRAGTPMTAELSSTTDHLAIVRHAASLPAPIQEAVEHVAITGEVEAGRISLRHDRRLSYRHRGQ